MYPERAVNVYVCCVSHSGFLMDHQLESGSKLMKSKRLLKRGWKSFEEGAGSVTKS
jgi:hypothetical protein